MMKAAGGNFWIGKGWPESGSPPNFKLEQSKDPRPGVSYKTFLQVKEKAGRILLFQAFVFILFSRVPEWPG